MTVPGQQGSSCNNRRIAPRMLMPRRFRARRVVNVTIDGRTLLRRVRNRGTRRAHVRVPIARLPCGAYGIVVRSRARTGTPNPRAAIRVWVLGDGLRLTRFAIRGWS